MPEQLVEHVSDWQAAVVVEQASRSIRNVALAGSESKNGYRYTESALQSASALYEQTPVFLDHPSSVQRPRDRSARDLAGNVGNVRYESGRLRGDIQTLDTEAGRTLLALAAANFPGVGMSHVVTAERSRDGATVERIVEVISVDCVVFPATTQTFRENTNDEANLRGQSDSVPLSLGRGVRGEGSVSTSSFRVASRKHAELESVQLASDVKRIPSPPAPLPRERGELRDGDRNRAEPETRIRRVRHLMSDTRTGVPVPHEPFDSAEPPASCSGIQRSAPTPGSRQSDSLERLLAAIDSQLPGHLRRLAAASELSPRGRGARVGVFPNSIVVEWSAVGALPEHFAVPWQYDGERVVLGNELIPLADLTEQTTWPDVLSASPFAPRKEVLSRSERRQSATQSSTLSSENDDETRSTIEHLTEQLRQVTAERDRLNELFAQRGPTSTLRRTSSRDVIADEQFVRVVKRH